MARFDAYLIGILAYLF